MRGVRKAGLWCVVKGCDGWRVCDGEIGVATVSSVSGSLWPGAIRVGVR